MAQHKTRASTIAAAAALLLAPAIAAAQAPSEDHYLSAGAGTNWSLKKVRVGTGECTMIVNHGAVGLDAAGTKFVKERVGSGGVTAIEWVGTCDANGLIAGKGSLFIDLDASAHFYSKRFIGTADRGVLNGPASYNAYYDEEAAEYDELDPDQPINFANGCNDWNGVRPNSCDRTQADRLRRQYLASRGAATPGPAPAKPTPKPVAATPAKPAGPVAVDIPPSETGHLNDQQNAAAAAWLKADTEARRIQAEKVADFERKQADFNQKQADYEKQQADYRAAVAAHQAEVARVARANADIDACNKGDRSRCPTPN